MTKRCWSWNTLFLLEVLDLVAYPSELIFQSDHSSGPKRAAFTILSGDKGLPDFTC